MENKLFMNIEEINMYIDSYKEDVNKAYDHLIEEMSTIRAGRANPKLVERIMVDYYGTLTPINQMATISVPEARMLVVSLWDTSMIKAVTKAINEANLGVNPSDDGRVIRLVFPQLTEERRKEFAKEISKMTENCKVVCRNARRDVLDVFKKMKKDNELTEDELAKLEKDVQKILDDISTLIDKSCDQKQKEIMTT